MSSIPSISGSTSQTASSGASGAGFDAQGRFTFGGITTTGVGGRTSTNDLSSYISMGIIAAVVVAVAFMVLKK